MRCFYLYRFILILLLNYEPNTSYIIFIFNYDLGFCMYSKNIDTTSCLIYFKIIQDVDDVVLLAYYTST